MRSLRDIKLPKLRFKKRIKMESIKDLEQIRIDYDKVEEEIKTRPRRHQPYPATNYTTVKEIFERSMKLYADRPFILQKPSHKEPYRIYTYREFQDTVYEFGTMLKRMLPNDSKVIIVSETRYEWYVSYMACLCGAGIAVPTDKELPDNELENVINRAGAKAVIYSNKKKDSIRKIEKSLPTVKFFIEMDSDERIRGTHVGMGHMIREGIDYLQSGDKSFINTKIDPDAFKVLIFTSGTTARSKGVMISNRNLAANINGVSEYVNLLPTDRLFSVLPLHHTYESTIGFLLPMATGSSIAVCEGLRYIAANMQESHPTALLAVPLLIETMYKRIRKAIKKGKKGSAIFSLVHVTNMMKSMHVDIKRRVFKEILDNFGGELRYVVSAAAPIDGQICKWIDGIGIKFLQGYGLTETAPIAALTPEYETPRYGSTGKAVKDTTIKILNPNEDGEGEIAIKGPTVMLGYYEDEEETAKVMKDGFFLSGDIGRIDEDGYIYITGRSKNVIVTQNGKNIYPEEIELLLGDVQEISEVMVYGKEQPDNSKEGKKKKEKDKELTVTARIIPNYDRITELHGPHLSDDEIKKILWDRIKEVNKKLENYKAIKEIEIKKDEFEKTTTLKIRRYAEIEKSKQENAEQNTTQGGNTMQIKAVKFRRDGFYGQPFAFGGEEGPDKFDKNVRYRGSLQNYLIDTGDEVILVDTGLPKGTPEEVPDENSPAFTGHDICSYMDAFEALGYQPEQVTKILLTHKHADHSGELRSFPNAKIYVNEDEIGAAELEGLNNLVPVSFTDGAYYNFPACQKISDGIYFIKAKGHTNGNSIIIVELDGLFYMIHGDITYVDEALYANKLSVVYDDKDAARETLDRVREFIRNHPTVYCGTHTPQGYENLEEKRVMDLDNPVETIPAVVDFSAVEASGKYVCSICGYVYDPAEHDGVAFEDLPDDWKCPRCKQSKEKFNKA